MNDIVKLVDEMKAYITDAQGHQQIVDSIRQNLVAGRLYLTMKREDGSVAWQLDLIQNAGPEVILETLKKFEESIKANVTFFQSYISLLERVH